jgi:hypothetical protein
MANRYRLSDLNLLKNQHSIFVFPITKKYPCHLYRFAEMSVMHRALEQWGYGIQKKDAALFAGHLKIVITSYVLLNADHIIDDPRITNRIESDPFVNQEFS